jgi:SAM-dependent methyltransferase
MIDLGSSPPSNAYLSETTLKAPEKWFPLKVMVCDNCWLAQNEDYTGANELFDEDYAYFSSFSSSWLKHAEQYTQKMVERFNLNNKSHVIEVASNDGYLLQFFKQKNIPCLGIEPTHSTAEAARKIGIKVIEDFFGVGLAKKLVADTKSADLTVANNVLAHVPDINDFVSGFATLLKPNGVATFEFPHLMRLIEQGQFDTIYHEHFSYLSLTAVTKIFSANGLKIFDIDELTTHGGSLRVYAQRIDTGIHPVTASVDTLLKTEQSLGMLTPDYYKSLQEKANTIKNNLYQFLIEAKQSGKSVIGYGAAAKGNTLLNYAGIKSDLLAYVVDKNPAKQHKHLPGSRIPILDESMIHQTKPNYVLILPWNLKTEVADQLNYIRTWNGEFVTAVPELSVF